MAGDYKWHEITDLPQDLRLLESNELEPLHRIWLHQKDSLAEQRIVEEFNQQLKREWAIETGAIEGVYVLDRGVTQILIEHGIKSSLIPHSTHNESPEHVATIIQDQAEALDCLFDFVKGDRSLTTGFIKELHQALLRHQETVDVVDQLGRHFEEELQKGAYKTIPNNPRREDGTIFEYCPPEHVAAEMDRLLALHDAHTRRAVPPEVEAAWLHHRFTQIHPFEDGNGRVARAIASLVFIKARWFPLIIRNTGEKAKYLEALEFADAGDLGPLISLFCGVQKRVFLTALDLSYRVTPPGTIDAAVESARDLFVGMGKIVPKEWMAAKEIAGRLYVRTLQRLSAAAAKLQTEIGSVQPRFRFGVNQSGGVGVEESQIVQVARTLGYSANLAEYNQMADLQLLTARTTKIVVSFHGVGTMYRGIIAVSAFLETDAGEPVPVCEEFFQINYEEEQSQTESRYETWLERSIARGLTIWQQSVLGEF